MAWHHALCCHKQQLQQGQPGCSILVQPCQQLQLFTPPAATTQFGCRHRQQRHQQYQQQQQQQQGGVQAYQQQVAGRLPSFH
jgi:hypothetical protein